MYSTNLQFCYNELGLKCSKITSDITLSNLYNIYNLIDNNKKHYLDIQQDLTSVSITFDMGNNGVSDNTFSFSSFVFNLNRFPIAKDFEIEIEGSNSLPSYTSIKTYTDTAVLAGLKGVNESDYIDTFTPTTSYRYIRVTFSKASAGNLFEALNAYGINKFFIGNLFDIGRDPDDIQIKLFSEKKPFETEFGNYIFHKAQDDLKHIILNYTLISDAKLKALTDIIKLQKNTLFYLYCINNKDFFDGIDLLSANLIEFKAIKKKNYNEVQLVFKEVR